MKRILILFFYIFSIFSQSLTANSNLDHLCTDDQGMRSAQCEQWRERAYAALLISKKKLLKKYLASKEQIAQLDVLFETFMYYLQQGATALEAYEASGFKILTLSYNEKGQPVYKGGHSLVLWHPEFPDYIIKLDAALKRLQGLEILQKACGKDCPYVLPKKYIAGPKNSGFLIAEKINFMPVDSPDYQSFLSTRDKEIQDLSGFLNQTGYCDGHRGNIKVTHDGKFAILDTDFSFFKSPNQLCRATERLYTLGKHALGYNPVCSIDKAKS